VILDNNIVVNKLRPKPVKLNKQVNNKLLFVNKDLDKQLYLHKKDLAPLPNFNPNLQDLKYKLQPKTLLFLINTQ